MTEEPNPKENWAGERLRTNFNEEDPKKIWKEGGPSRRSRIVGGGVKKRQ